MHQLEGSQRSQVSISEEEPEGEYEKKVVMEGILKGLPKLV